MRTVYLGGGKLGILGGKLLPLKYRSPNLGRTLVPFHLISNRNFRNFWLNAKHPLSVNRPYLTIRAISAHALRPMGERHVTWFLRRYKTDDRSWQSPLTLLIPLKLSSFELKITAENKHLRHILTGLPSTQSKILKSSGKYVFEICEYTIERVINRSYSRWNLWICLLQHDGSYAGNKRVFTSLIQRS